MNTKKAFNLYFGTHLHFTQKSYSVVKYGTNTKSAEAKFNSMSQSQLFRFEWLAAKFPDTQDFMYACIGCAFDEISMQFGNKDEIYASYIKFKGRREAMSYKLKEEVTRHELSGNLPVEKLIFKYLIGEYSPEYILILCYNTDKLDDLYNSPNLSWARDKILKLIKYTDFFNSKKYSSLLSKNEQHANS